jgi:hypothetical protein
MNSPDLSAAQWRKSSQSGPEGGQCVEIAECWRKSSRSGGGGGQCVEVAAVQRSISTGASVPEGRSNR